MIPASLAAGPDNPVWFNAYSLHYDLLRHQVLEAASASPEDLEDAGIELTEGWLLGLNRYPNDCQTYLTRFEALKSLHMLGTLSVYDIDRVVPNMRRYDVFFALALQDNGAANYLFSKTALDTDWDRVDAVRYGLEAAVSAANAFNFGLLLKAQLGPLQRSPLHRCGTVVGSYE